MVVKFAVTGQAQGRKNNGQIVQIGPVRQEVINGACKLAMIPVGENPCVLECSEFTPTIIEPTLRMPVKEQEGVTV
jgi:hypothetical protein